MRLFSELLIFNVIGHICSLFVIYKHIVFRIKLIWFNSLNSAYSLEMKRYIKICNDEVAITNPFYYNLKNSLFGKC